MPIIFYNRRYTIYSQGRNVHTRTECTLWMCRIRGLWSVFTVNLQPVRQCSTVHSPILSVIPMIICPSSIWIWRWIRMWRWRSVQLFQIFATMTAMYSPSSVIRWWKNLGRNAEEESLPISRVSTTFSTIKLQYISGRVKHSKWETQEQMSSTLSIDRSDIRGVVSCMLWGRAALSTEPLSQVQWQSWWNVVRLLSMGQSKAPSMNRLEFNRIISCMLLGGAADVTS